MSETQTLNKDAGAYFFRPRRLAHANLNVDGYQRMFDFYNSVAGFEEAYRQTDKSASFISNGNTYHDMGLMDICERKLAKPGLNHLAFELENEVALADGYRRANEAGRKFAFMQDHNVAHSVYLRDPDGNMVEIYADVIAEWRDARHGDVQGKNKPRYIPGETSVPLAESCFPVDPELRTVENSIFRARRVTHAGIVAADFDAMYDFYTDFVGLTPMAGKKSSDVVLLRGTNSNGDIALYRGRAGEETGLHHVGVEVGSEADLDRALGLLPKAGIKSEREVDHPARRTITIRDPNGFRLQFFVNRKWPPQSIDAVDPDTARFLL
jgi:catechol 2,3-dioxygenase